jgi:hypothetical protein
MYGFPNLQFPPYHVACLSTVPLAMGLTRPVITRRRLALVSGHD